ncbi:HEPN domain-containing protein, partial [Vibrio anguillarum]
QPLSRALSLLEKIVDKWLDFYRPYFDSEEKLVAFVEQCESLTLEDKNHRAKIMMHQGQRLSTISGAMEDIAAGRDPLKLLFLLVAAENISKLHLSTDEEGRSKFHVKRFFTTFCCGKTQRNLVDKIEVIKKPRDLDTVVSALYTIRCDVVHEGLYWGFDFATDARPSVLSSKDGSQLLRVRLTFAEFQEIVVKGVISAVRDIL